MKMFVWNNPYPVSYGGSCLFVMAETEDDARKLAPSVAISQYGCEAGGKMPDFDISMPPDWTADVPGGVCYEWSE